MRQEDEMCKEEEEEEGSVNVTVALNTLQPQQERGKCHDGKVPAKILLLLLLPSCQSLEFVLDNTAGGGGGEDSRS